VKNPDRIRNVGLIIILVTTVAGMLAFFYFEKEKTEYFFQALSKGNVARTNILLKLDPQLVGIQDRYGMTPLSMAAYCSDPLLCKKCSGKMKIISFISDFPVIKKILKHLNLWHLPTQERPPPTLIVDYDEDGCTSHSASSDYYFLDVALCRN